MNTPVIISLSLIVFVLTVVIVLYFLIRNNAQEQLNRFRKKLSNNPVVIPIVFLFTIGFLIIAALVISKTNSFINILGEITNSEGYGPIGDFINGILAPILGVISIFFLYKAFKEQLIANKWFRNFEQERTFREYFSWISDDKQIKNVIYVQNIIEEKDTDGQKEYFDAISIKETLKWKNTIYQMTKFVRIFKQVRRIQSESPDLDIQKNILEIESEMLELINAYYLQSYKEIAGELLVHFDIIYRNNFPPTNYSSFMDRIEIQMLLKFKEFYFIISDYDHDENVEYTLNQLAEFQNSVDDFKLLLS